MLSRLLLSLAAAVAVAGCVRYYERPCAGDAGIYYGSDYGRAHHDPAPVNPAVYPYWSLDYFYFSRYHHPYSVFVGYREPLYYPYPGWFYGSYRGAYAHHGRFGYGYPWFGHGFYPRYSLGFFIAGRHDHGHHGHHGGDHRLRAIDGRLRALQAPRQAPSRSALVGSRRAGIPIGGHPAGYRSHTIRPDGRADVSRARAALLQRGVRDSHRGSTQRRRDGRGMREEGLRGRSSGERLRMLRGRGETSRDADPGRSPSELRSRSRQRDPGQARRAPAPDFGTRQRSRTGSAPPRAAPAIGESNRCASSAAPHPPSGETDPVRRVRAATTARGPAHRPSAGPACGPATGMPAISIAAATAGAVPAGTVECRGWPRRCGRSRNATSRRTSNDLAASPSVRLVTRAGKILLASTDCALGAAA